MMNRAIVRKFLPENLPSNLLSSSTARSASATPSDIQSSGRGVDYRGGDFTGGSYNPRSILSPVSSFFRDRIQFQKRPRIKDPSQEEVPPVDTAQAPPPPSFPLPMMTLSSTLRLGCRTCAKWCTGRTLSL
ncbi:hypothetical protein Salat_2163000 [Sesamum alatum]|uniref:Uncharacterized protein n=1 Tax=Sesamum alatum TaxID=300844 RepID=A0AAE2CHC0_9LAMI|nr:hypothetical protein Salat_2163000 [Sesamum alatum]